MSNSKKSLIQVYFYALPKKVKFIHKGQIYTKIGDESVKDGNGKLWTFEGHYGCMIDKKKFKRLNLKKENIRKN